MARSSLGVQAHRIGGQVDVGGFAAQTLGHDDSLEDVFFMILARKPKAS